MEEFYSEHELEIMMQFYHICKRVIHDAGVDCLRKLSKDESCVIVSSELVENELNRQGFMEDYITDVDVFHVLDMDIEVKDELLFQALERLSEHQRNIILLFYYRDMSDGEIANEMHKVRSTICYHRTSSLQKLREIILVYEFLQFGALPEIDLDGLGLSVVVHGQPEYLRSGRSLSDVILLVAGDACHSKSLGITYCSLALSIDDIIYCPLVIPVEKTDIHDVLSEECLVRHLCHHIFSILVDDDYL